MTKVRGEWLQKWNSLHVLMALGLATGPVAGCADNPDQLASVVSQALDQDSERDLDYDDEGKFKGHGRYRHKRSTGLPWASIGPAPPAIEAPVAIDNATGTIYIASFGGGVLKSTNNGASFTEVNNGLNSIAVSSMAMVAGNPNQVYVGTANGGIFKTVDGGATWNITGELTGLVITLSVDPNNPNVAYAGYQGTVPIKKTTDGGATWVPASTGVPASTAVWNIAVDRNNPNVLFAATSGTGAFKSTNGGASWSALTGLPSTVWYIYIDPTDSNTIFAGTNGDGVYKSTNAGASFARVGSPDVGVVLSIAKSGSTLYAGAVSDGVSVASDGGATWTVSGLANGIGLVLSTDSTGAVYAATNLDGVRKTVNGGADWTRVGWNNLKDCNCQNGHALAVDPVKNRHVLFTTNDGGLIETRNGGTAWIDGGRRGFQSRAPRSVAFDPQDPSRVYAGAFTGGGFYRSEDGGKTWERNLFAGDSMQVTGVAVDPVDQSVYVCMMGQVRGVYKSTDYGVTFTRIDRATPTGPFLNLNGRGITIDPSNHNNIYFGGNTGVYRSQDAGATWKQIDTIFALTVTVDPTDSNIVYAGTQTNGVRATTNATQPVPTFISINNGLPPSTRTSRTGGVQVDPRNHNVLYVGTEGTGVFKSVNGGLSWYPINAGVDNPLVFGTRIDPVEPDTLYVATSSSVYKTTTGGE